MVIQRVKLLFLFLKPWILLVWHLITLQMSYMISAWARICKILGPGFAPYLPLVMGPILKTASMKPEVALLDNDELGGVSNDSEDWQFVSLGEQQNFGIKTSGSNGLKLFLLYSVNWNHPKISTSRWVCVNKFYWFIESSQNMACVFVYPTLSPLKCKRD